MSNSQEFRQELLSAYLDDAVSDDERVRVERMIESDPLVLEELDALRRLQADTRDALQLDARLDEQFHERVWAGVLQQADDEQLPASHPVRIATKRPDVVRLSGSKKMLVGLGALAASVALIFVVQRAGQSDPPIQDIASVDSPDSVPDNPVVNPDSPVINPNVPANGGSGDLIAVSPPRSVPNDTAGEPRVVPDELVTPKSPSEQLVGSPSPVPSAADLNKLKFAVVFEVQLTQRGRDRNELEYALETAEIEHVSPHEISPSQLKGLVASKTIGSVDADDANSDADTQVLLLKGPGKRIDRFMLSLITKPSAVKSVGFQMVMDPNLVATIDDMVRPDASSIRHSDQEALATFLRLGSSGGATMFHRSNRRFLPLGETSLKNLNWSSKPPKDEGPDIQVQVLVLVRNP